MLNPYVGVYSAMSMSLFKTSAACDTKSFYANIFRRRAYARAITITGSAWPLVQSNNFISKLGFAADECDVENVSNGNYDV